MTIALIVFVWLACTVACYGMQLYYWQTSFPLIAPEQYQSDLAISVATSLGGPVALFAWCLWRVAHTDRRKFWGFRFK